MSLFKQMVIMLSLFLGLILVSVMILNFKTATEFVQNQLYTDAKNTAYSLGLSLSKIEDPTDRASMETMINAIYDSGYYQRIKLVDIDGNEIYSRENDVRVHDVPQWFIERVHIQNVTVKSDIMIGWNRFGTLAVSGHTGHAYRQLYLTLMDLVQTFMVIGVIVFVGLYVLLSFSLKALVRIRKQAEAITDNEFIIETKIPFTTEFRSVTVAMNAMVAKVKDIFNRENETLQRYHELLYRDSDTKLYNRRYLVAKLPDYLQSHSALSAGIYIMFSLDGIDRLKREMGYQQDLSFINAFADILKAELGALPNALIARLNEKDFFVVVPETDTAFIYDLVERIMSRMRDVMNAIDSIRLYVILGSSVGTYSEKDTLKSLFARADHGVMEAQNRGNFIIEVSQPEEETLILGRDEWRDELLESVQESRMVLACQSVVENQSDGFHLLHEEIFLRLLDKEGTIHSAGYFIPVATSLGLAAMLDRYMIEKVLHHIREHNSSVPLALNISSDFIKKYSNIEWLKGELELFSRENGTTLWFEVSNTIALNDPDSVRSLSTMVKTLGHSFGIDHFVLPEDGAGYLQTIRPDYIKSNADHLSDMMIDAQSGNVRESLNNVVTSLGISIIAMMIENNEQVEVLKKLGINRLQGVYIAPATMLK